MIVYFDTSAFVPLLTHEAASAKARQLWITARRVVICQLLYVEAAAAIARAERLGRLTQTAMRKAMRELDVTYEACDIIKVSEALIRRAAVVAMRQRLRGYDAMHCACAESVTSASLVVASGDAELLNACQSLGMSTANTHR